MDLIRTDKKIILFVNLILSLIFIVLLVTTFQYCWSINFPLLRQISKPSILRFLSLVVIIISILTLIIFNEIVGFIKKEAEAKIAEQRLKDSQEMVQVLRANQHDFINHLQVICGAAQLGKLEVIEEYSKGIVKQVKEISVISNIYYPEIAALLYTKISKADEIEAKVYIDINTNLKNLLISSIDLSRVLGNLIDNAIYAIGEVEKAKREIAVNIREDNDSFKFTIFNRYPVIPQDIQSAIFNSGYTTKGEKGSGLGLYNVKTIVEKYHGNVEVISSEDKGTSFIVTINK